VGIKIFKNLTKKEEMSIGAVYLPKSKKLDFDSI
jgi:hypothetical protein